MTLLTMIIWQLLAPSFAQMRHLSNPIDVGPMKVSWSHDTDEVYFVVDSPGQGWVALGTNERNDIVGASLYMGGWDEGGDALYFSERYTVSPGKHHPKIDLGYAERVRSVDVTTTPSGTQLTFRLRAVPDTAQEHDLRAGSKIWLILAYSVSDDLGHHSRFRRHVEVTL